MKFDLSCLPSQAKFHKLAVQHPVNAKWPPPRFRGFSGPVGSGKTQTVCDHLLYLAYENEGRTGLLGSATYPLLRDAAQKTLFERMEHHKMPFLHSKSKNTIVLRDVGTSILCRSLDNYERLRGTNLAFFGVDELTYCPDAAWLRLEARLRDPLAKERAACAAWTPNGFDSVYKRFIRNPTRDYCAILAQPYENTYLERTYYSGLLASYSVNFGKQEVLGKYLNIFSGRAYSAFESGDGGHIWHREGGNGLGFVPCHYTRARPLLWALDFNISPASSVICQTVSRTPGVSLGSAIGGKHAQLNVLDEIFLHDANTQTVCEEFHNRALKKQVHGERLHVIVYGDATGTRRQSSASKSDYAIVREFFARMSDYYTFELRIPASNPMVKDRVEAVNSMCLNGAGQRRLLLHERCKELALDLEQMAWKVDSSGNLEMGQLEKKNPDRGHISDALGYLIHMEFALRNSVGFKPVFVA